MQVALSQFVDWGRIRYAQRTVDTYRGLINRFIVWTKNKKLCDITIDDVTQYYLNLKKRGYAESSIAFMMISLRQFFRFLFLRGEIKWDYQLIQIPKYMSNSYPPATKAIFEEMSKMKVCNFKDLRDKTILHFLYSSGVRVSELCAIKIADISLEKGFGVIISKKNQKKRMIFWDDQTREILARYLLQRTEHSKSPYLFISIASRNLGQKLTTRSVQRIVEAYRQSPDITPHSFRHGLGMRAVQANIHPRYIQQILGHKNLNSQEVYLDTVDQEVKQAYDKIKGD